LYFVSTCLASLSKTDVSVFLHDGEFYVMIQTFVPAINTCIFCMSQNVFVYVNYYCFRRVLQCLLIILTPWNFLMSTSFPSFAPHTTNALWFSAGEPYDDEIELCMLEERYRNWVRSRAIAIAVVLETYNC